MFFCVYDMRKQGKTKGRKTRIEKNFHISPSTPFPPLSTTATQFGLRYSACRKVVGFLRFIQAQNERELIPRRACPRSTPTSSFGSPPPPKKTRKMASFLLTQFEVDFNFWTKITVLFIWEESSGPFCLLCPERSRRKVLMFFSRGVQY